MHDGAARSLTSELDPPEGGSKREYRRWAKAARAYARAQMVSAQADTGPASADLSSADEKRHSSHPQTGPDERICSHIQRSPLFMYAQTVAIYLPMAGEVNIELLVAPGKRFVAPRMHEQPEPHLTFHALGTEPLEQHPWGVRQPSASAPEVPLDQIDLLIVPGLLFDRRWARLGYGKGYYDRLLAQRTTSKPVTLGVALEALVLPVLPTDPHDLAVDHLVTDLGFIPLNTSSSSQLG